MALNYVTLTLDLYDGQGNYPITGTASFTPSVQLTDTTDHELIIQAPVVVAFRPSAVPAVSLLATDNGAVLPSGWAWTVSFTGVSGNPAGFSFFLPFSGGAAQNLSSLSPVSTAVTQFAQNPMTTLGDMIYGLAAGNPARVAGNTAATKKFLTQTGTGSVSAAPAWAAIAAADLPAATTSTQGAVILDGTAADIQPVGVQAAGATGKAADAGHVHPYEPWQFPVEAYGAKGNGIIGTGGTGTSGTSTFTDAGAAWVAGDAGKVIVINQGAGGSNQAPFCGTISAVNSATSITLSGNLAANAASAPYIYGTDDAAAITSAVNAASTYAQANQYHAQVIFGAKNYMLAALTQVGSGQKYNTHIPIPVGPQNGRKLVIDLVGVSTGMDAGNSQFWQPVIPNLHGTCLVSAVSASGQPDGTFGQQSVIGGSTALLGGALFNNTLLVIDGITVVCPWNSQQYGVDGTLLCQMNVPDGAYLGFAPVNFGSATCGGPNYQNSAIVGNGVSTGFYFPKNNNNDADNAGNVSVAGAAIGIFFTEHFCATKLTLTYCDHALQISGLANGGGGQHGATILQASVENCNWAFYNSTSSTSGPFALFIGLLDLETVFTGHVYDPNSNLGGVVNWANPTAGHPVVTGGTALSVINCNLAPGVWAGAPAAPSSGTAQQNQAYRDATVYVTSTAAITALAVDGTSIFSGSLASGTLVPVRVPSGHTYTVTSAGGTLTTKWVLD